jgi:hypothetical protein
MDRKQAVVVDEEIETATTYRWLHVRVEDASPRGGRASHAAMLTPLKDGRTDIGTPAHVSGVCVRFDTASGVVAKSVGAEQTEGTAIYRDDNTWQIVTINFHLFGAGCQLFGDMLTNG